MYMTFYHVLLTKAHLSFRFAYFKPFSIHGVGCLVFNCLKSFLPTNLSCFCYMFKLNFLAYLG